jgi:hypothetical protein
MLPGRAGPALAAGTASVPANTNDVAAAASQADPRMPHTPAQILNFSCYYIPVSHPEPQEIQLIEARQRCLETSVCTSGIEVYAGRLAGTGTMAVG